MALDAVVRDIQHMPDSDIEYLEHIAAVAGDAPGQFVGEPRARVRFVGEPHRLPQQPHTYAGIHGPMGVIDIVDFDVDVAPGQPNPPKPEWQRRLGQEPVGPEPGRQESTGPSDDGSDAVGEAGSSLTTTSVHAINSVGNIGLAAEAAGIWADDSVHRVASVEIPLTQAYCDSGAAASPGTPRAADGAGNVGGASDACSDADVSSLATPRSDADSSASTAATERTPIQTVAFFPTFPKLPIPRCQKCGREVDPYSSRLGKKVETEGIQVFCLQHPPRPMRACFCPMTDGRVLGV